MLSDGTANTCFFFVNFVNISEEMNQTQLNNTPSSQKFRFQGTFLPRNFYKALLLFNIDGSVKLTILVGSLLSDTELKRCYKVNSWIMHSIWLGFPNLSDFISYKAGRKWNLRTACLKVDTPATLYSVLILPGFLNSLLSNRILIAVKKIINKEALLVYEILFERKV